MSAATWPDAVLAPFHGLQKWPTQLGDPSPGHGRKPYAKVFTFLRPNAHSAPRFKAETAGLLPSPRKSASLYTPVLRGRRLLPPDHVRLCMRAHTFGRLRPALPPATLKAHAETRQLRRPHGWVSGATAGSGMRRANGRKPSRDQGATAYSAEQGDVAARSAHPRPDHRPRPPAASGVPVRGCAQAVGGGRGLNE